MKRLAVALAGLLLALLATACGSTTSPTGQKATPEAATQTSKATKTTAPTSAAPKRATVGQALIVTGRGGLKAKVTLVSVKTYQSGTGPLAEKPDHGYFLVANVKIAVESGTYAFNPLYFKLTSSDGNTYSAFDGKAMMAGYDPMLSAGTLSAGQSTGGNVIFDVPGPHGVLQLTDPLGGVVGEWTV